MARGGVKFVKVRNFLLIKNIDPVVFFFFFVKELMIACTAHIIIIIFPVTYIRDDNKKVEVSIAIYTVQR